MPRLRLSFLGPFQVTLDGKLVSSFEADKVRALLAYLAVESSRPHRREQLAAMFWPGWPDASARTSLRNALSNLRKAIGDETADPPFLLISRETIQFNPEASFSLDTLELEHITRDSRSAPEQLQSVLDHYRGGFLEGFTLKDCPAFDDWSGVVRDQLQTQASAALARLGELYEADKHYEKAIGCARKRLELEPWQEDAHRQLMRLLALCGQRPAALAQFEACKRSLKSELGVEPSAELVRLYESIRNNQPPETKQEKTHPHNLPAQLTSFIGREKEIERVDDLLKKNRLVTLTGPGGTGKTRLSLQIAAELLEDFPDGVWLVELAPIADPDLVTQTAANSLGMHLSAGPQTFSFLVDYLQPKRLLMIFDNCEHLIATCARLVDALLHACSNLSILVSSREALGIEGETSFLVPPLTTPEIHQQPNLDELAQYEAIRLFVERAGIASPGFQLTADNSPTIVQVCQRLDGIPLAIELAATRLKLLSVDEIALRLEDRFRLLTGGSRVALPRYQTLRASIDWSYELLSAPERLLLLRLSVFAGGWFLEAAEYVGCGEVIESYEVLELLGGLVNKSLVFVESETGLTTRYRMLETIRQYAQEKLVEAGQAEVVRDRHLQYYLELAEKVEWKIRGPDQARLLEQLEADLDNLRLALAWSLEGKGKAGWNPELGLRLAAALQWFWHCRGWHEEGLEWLERLLLAEAEAPGEIPAPFAQVKTRAWALRVAGYFAFCLWDFRKAAVLSERSRNIFASLGPEGKRGYAYAQYTLAEIAEDHGNPLQAKILFEESLAIFQEVGDQFAISECLEFLGMSAYRDQKFEQARKYFEEDLAIRREIGDQDGTANVLYLLGKREARQNEYGKARKLWEESRKMFSQVQDIWAITWVIQELGNLNWMEGNYAQAAQDFDEILVTGRSTGNLSAISVGIYALGNLHLSQGDCDRAASLFEEYLSFGHKMGSKNLIRDSLLWLGRLAWVQNDFSQAIQQYSEALVISRELGDQFIEAIVLCGLGKASLAGGNTESAHEYFAKALELLPMSYFIDEGEEILEGIAFLAIIQHQAQRAACLLGSTQALYDHDSFQYPPKNRLERENAIACLRQALGEEAFTKAWEEGRAMTLEQAVAYAKQP